MDETHPPVPDSAVEKPGIRGAFHIVLEHLGDHVELFKLEAGQELSRIATLMGMWFALAFLLELLLIFVVGVTIASLWDTAYRTHAIVGSGAVLLLATLYCVWTLKRASAQASSRFDSSSEQWRRDIALIKELT